MKDYDHMVIWPDYFNSNLSRAQGRRLPRAECISAPILEELEDAARAADYKIAESNGSARFPRRPHVRSGYIVLPKRPPKSGILRRISRALISARGKRPKR